MANYSLVIDSRFKPFEYQEMLAPVLRATQEQNALEDAYAELGTKANIWDNLTEGSNKAHGIYQRYAEDLKSLAEELVSTGTSPTSRAKLNEMRARYAKDILPIEAAYKRREEQIKEQMKAGNSQIFSYNAGTTNLDEYLNNPSLAYSSIDRKDLRTRAEAAFSHFKDQLRRFEYDPIKKLDKFHNTLIEEYGLSPEQAAMAIEEIRQGKISNDNAAVGIVYNNLYRGTGVDAWQNPTASNAVQDTILEGIMAGVGKEKASLQNDEGALAANRAYWQDWLHKQAEGREANRKAQEAELKANQERLEALNSSFGSPIVFGISNANLKELQKDKKRLEGMVRIDDENVSTTRLQSYEKKIKEANDKLSKYTKADRDKFSKMPAAGTTMSGYTNEDFKNRVAYNKYKAQKEAFEKLKQEELDWINSKYAEYENYDSTKDKFARLTAGINTLSNQGVSNNVVLPYTADPTSYDKVLEGLSKTAISSGNKLSLYEVDTETGKQKSSKKDLDEVKSFYMNANNTSSNKNTGLGVYFINDNIFLGASDGDKIYKISSTSNNTLNSNVDYANDKLTKVNKYLKDFSNKSKKIVLTDKEVNNFLDKGVLNLPTGNESLENVAPNIKGIMLQTNSGQRVKLLIEGNQIIAYQTLDDEKQGGRHRAELMQNMGKNTLYNLVSSFASKQ